MRTAAPTMAAPVIPMIPSVLIPEDGVAVDVLDAAESKVVPEADATALLALRDRVRTCVEGVALEMEDEELEEVCRQRRTILDTEVLGEKQAGTNRMRGRLRARSRRFGTRRGRSSLSRRRRWRRGSLFRCALGRGRRFTGRGSRRL